MANTRIYENLMRGGRVEPVIGRTCENRNSLDLRHHLAAFQTPNEADIKLLINAAKQPWQTWRPAPAPRKRDIALRLGEILVREKHDPIMYVSPERSEKAKKPWYHSEEEPAARTAVELQTQRHIRRVHGGRHNAFWALAHDLGICTPITQPESSLPPLVESVPHDHGDNASMTQVGIFSTPTVSTDGEAGPIEGSERGPGGGPKSEDEEGGDDDEEDEGGCEHQVLVALERIRQSICAASWLATTCFVLQVIVQVILSLLR